MRAFVLVARIAFAVAIAAVALGLAAIIAPTADTQRNPTYQGKTAKQWHDRAVRRRHERDDLQTRLTRRVREVSMLRRTLLRRPSSLEAIRLAAIAYRINFDRLYRIASCESTGSRPASPPAEGTLYAHAKNSRSTASGLFQFLYPSTWRSTPYAAESVWSPYASALAAGWMWRQGRGREWVCR